MKKTYIAPNAKIHHLRVESMLMAKSDATRAYWGTKPNLEASVQSEEDAYADDDALIPWVEGDNWSTL